MTAEELAEEIVTYLQEGPGERAAKAQRIAVRCLEVLDGKPGAPLKPRPPQRPLPAHARRPKPAMASTYEDTPAAAVEPEPLVEGDAAPEWTPPQEPAEEEEEE